MTTEERIQELKQTRASAYQHLLSSHKIYDRAKKLVESTQSRYLQDRSEYEAADHSLALLDGRLVTEVAKPARNYKVKEVSIEEDLTEEQINRLAAKLGLVLPEVQEVPATLDSILTSSDKDELEPEYSRFDKFDELDDLNNPDVGLGKTLTHNTSDEGDIPSDGVSKLSLDGKEYFPGDY